MIGVLKRTIESAPTSPRERAREVFTTEITSKVVIEMKTKTRANFRLLDSTFA